MMLAEMEHLRSGLTEFHLAFVIEKIPFSLLDETLANNDGFYQALKFSKKEETG